MLLRAALFLFATTLILSNADDKLNPLSDEFIDMINSKQNSWKAGRNFPPQTSLDMIKRLLGAKKDLDFNKLSTIVHEEAFIAELPENFDARDKWPNCPSLNEVRDQGSCGSCWAIAAAEAMTDRYCIYSNGTQHFHFSTEDIISCFGSGDGCKGGSPENAWQYWKDSGIVSGGEYNSFQGCMPYEIPPCEHGVPGNRPPCNVIMETPKCEKTCEKNYNVSYNNDKKYGKNVYYVHGEANIRAEIFKNGPVEAVFDVYGDWALYKSGVYRSSCDGDILGKHAVKIIGWGVENDKMYWLITNSWNTDWGDKGFFKMLRGEDHCGIETGVVAGEPLFN